MKFDFTKNREVDTLDTVPDNFRDFYAEVPGANEGDASTYKLRDEPAIMNAVNTITGLNNALEASRRDVDEVKKNQVDLSPLKDYGEEPKAIAEAVAKRLKAVEDRSGQDVKSQVDAIRKELTEQFANANAQSQSQIDNLTRQLDDHMINNAISAACPHVHNASPHLVAPFARRRLKIDVDPDTGQRSITPLNREGNVMFSMDPNRAGEKASMVELLTDMASDPELQPIFPSANRSGSGAADSAGIPKKGKNIEDMSASQKIAEGLSELK